MDFIEQACYKRVICFDKQRYKLFEDVNSDIINGILIERSQIANNQKLTKVKLDNIATKELEITEIQEILSRGKIYERFYINSIFSNISYMTSLRNDDWTLITFPTAIIYNKSGQPEIKIFGKIVVDIWQSRCWRKLFLFLFMFTLTFIRETE